MPGKSIILNVTLPQRLKNYSYLRKLCTVNSVGGFLCGTLTALASTAIIKYAINEIKRLDEEFERLFEDVTLYEGDEIDGDE